MRISSLEIQNYRSIKSLELECTQLLTLLGPNNHGKSNILSALDFALSTSAKPTEADYFVHRDRDDNELWVEIEFCDLTEQEKRTFNKYVMGDNTIRIRKTARIENGNVETSYNGWITQPEDFWLKAEYAGNFTSRDAINETPLKDLVPTTGRITKAQVEEAQEKYAEQHYNELVFAYELEKGPLLGVKNVGGGVLPEFFLIPAVRDLTDEIKIKTTTTFGRLMNRAVREMAERDPRFEEARKQLEAVIFALNEREIAHGGVNELAALERSIEKELSGWGVRVNIEVSPPQIEKLFELGTDVHLDDGVRTTADRKGHGLQRAMMFALLRSWAEALKSNRGGEADGSPAARKQSDSVIFAMEEPELFLHPHAQRRLAEVLRAIADTPQHQVLLCTHSTYFVDLSHYKEVTIVTKDDPVKGSSVRQCTEDLFEGEADRKRRFHMAQWINPDRAELFFARSVVFVEGETEKVLIPYVARAVKKHDPNISIIDCGSKHNLPLYISIAKAFGISYVVVHDEDPLPDPIPPDWNEDKIREKRRTFQLNSEISALVEPPLGVVAVFEPDFEQACGVSKTKGKEKGKALAALEHFAACKVADIPEGLTRVVASCYPAA